MVGGAHRGPVGPGRQRRAIRLVQGLLILIAAISLGLAGYSYGERAGIAKGARSGGIDAPREPSLAQSIVLGVIGLGAFTVTLLLQASGGVRFPTPARLRDLEGTGELPVPMDDAEGPLEPAEPGFSPADGASRSGPT